MFIGRTDTEAKAPILWPPDAKSWLIGKDPGAGRDWGQEKAATEDEMVGWHHFTESPQVRHGQDLPWAEPSPDSINKVYRFSGFFIRCLPHRTVREQSVGEWNEANSTMLASAQCFGGPAKSLHTVSFMWYLRGTCGLRATGGTCAWVCVNIWAVHGRTIILAATWNNGLVQNWERSTPRLYLVTLLI